VVHANHSFKYHGLPKNY
jgi:hypothetical protein